MKIEFRPDPHPDPDFYYRHQFNIYHEAYLIWDMETWDAILSSCAVYRIEVDSEYAGDVILERRKKGTTSIVDFSLLPKFQRRGIGRVVLDAVKKMGKKITAVTRKKTLPFFLRCGFVVSRTKRSYYGPGIDGYDLLYEDPL